jgi:hypothetical protein
MTCCWLPSLAAKPDQDDNNLTKAARLASQGRPPEGPQRDTYFAIMKLKIAVAANAKGVDTQGLLWNAIVTAQKWAAAPGQTQ